ncbi:hypothetical protein F5X68DRAFT_245688 [Plectosphaerella plurivora]|uniref:Uncharacterized protein n=1 Tax=Plectosphaerella plurivora TaxID=936078 RepID=A0A9P8V778_9PEZI|nr:hypothetical protein F5X68DRAFT_245688 [Plectosphaerella plurivora]
MSPSLIVTLVGLAALPLALGQLTVAPMPHVVLAALNVVAPAADGSLSACSVAEARLAHCVRQVEGELEGLEQVLPCACCSSRRPFSTAYDLCASYIATSLTQMSTDYTLFSGMYEICGGAPAGFCRASSTGFGGRPSGGFTDAADPPTLTSSRPRPTTSTSTRRRRLHPACYSIAETVVECADATTELMEAPMRSFAPCVCYSTGRGGSMTYVGEDLQDLASTCASWGRSVLETDALIIATPFTTLCEAQATGPGALPGPPPAPTPSFGGTGNNNDENDDGSSGRDGITSSPTPTGQEAEKTTSSSFNGATRGVNGAASAIVAAAVMISFMIQM